jgi:hypothetical protein
MTTDSPQATVGEITAPAFDRLRSSGDAIYRRIRPLNREFGFGRRPRNINGTALASRWKS